MIKNKQKDKFKILKTNKEIIFLDRNKVIYKMSIKQFTNKIKEILK